MFYYTWLIARTVWLTWYWSPIQRWITDLVHRHHRSHHYIQLWISTELGRDVLFVLVLTYLLTYRRVYVVVIFCRVYAVFLSYFRYSTLRDIYIILTLRLSPYTVHIMAYNFYVDNVLFHYRQWVWILSRLYVTFILLRCYLVLCRNFNYFLVTLLLVVVFLAIL